MRNYFMFAFALSLVLPSLALAQVSHPASDVSAGNFTGDFRFVNGFLYIGDALGGVSSNAQRTYIAAPDGSIKLSAYNDRLEIGAGGLKFADGSTMASAAANIWTQSGTNVYYNGGNVGIGTAGPNAKLHVAGTLRVDDSASFPNVGLNSGYTMQFGPVTPVGNFHFSSLQQGTAIYVDSYGAGAGFSTGVNNLIFRRAEGSYGSPSDVSNGDGIVAVSTESYSGGAFRSTAQILVDVSGTFTSGQNPPTRMRFATNAAGAAPADVLTLTPNGNVGIGTTNPARKLDVLGDARIQGVGAALYFADATPTNKWHIGYVPAGNGLEFTETGEDVRMTLSNGGNVGIGTTTPGHLLTVGSGSNAVGNYPKIGVYGNGPTYISATYTPNNIQTFFGADSNNYGIFGTYSGHDVVLRTSNEERTRVRKDGDWGLGGTMNGKATVVYGQDVQRDYFNKEVVPDGGDMFITAVNFRGPEALVFLVVEPSTGNGNACLLMTRGNSGGVVIISDPENKCSTTKDTANRHNIYHEGNTANYRVQNKIGQTVTYHLRAMFGR
ncbi:MAG: hypothetical protein HY366_02015 [Candidatus Aenigmarchaeota archaeon]|nr:hypothetical protein [Candidatus Aenigmarchaeota archaeon]